MAKNYTITFKSLRSGTVYTVNIGGGTGTAVALKPATHPFETEESVDEDPFVPVRTQSGSIRILDDGKDINGNWIDNTLRERWWTDLTPMTDTQRPVTLTLGSTVLWQGFIQSMNLGATLYGNPQVREFLIQCPLSSAGCQDIILATSPVTAIHNFAWYLRLILNYIESVSNSVITFTYIYIQGGTDMRDNLLNMIDPQVFVDVDQNENTMKAKFNKYDVLEDICRYWGLSARVFGDSLYLMAPKANSTNFVRLNSSQLNTMANGTAAGTTISVSSVTIGDVFASMNNDITIHRGYSKITVKGDAGNASSTVMECFPGYVEDLIDDASAPSPWVHGDDRILYSGELASFSSIDLYGYTNGNSRFQRGQIYTIGNYNVDAEDDNILKIDDQYDENIKLALQTQYEHNYAGRNLTLYADTYYAGTRLDLTDNNNDYGDHYMYIRIGIGLTRGTAKWFDGDGWTTNPTAVKMTIGNKSNKLYYKVVGYDNLYENRIQVPDSGGYYGNLFIEFLGTDTRIFIDLFSMTYTFALVGFHVDSMYSLATTIPYKNWEDSTKEYEHKNNNIVQEFWEADCLFCSYGTVRYGYGVLMTPPPNVQPFSTYQEMVLGLRVSSYWNAAKRLFSTELLSNDSVVAGLSPLKEATIDNTDCYPISISRDWCDDVSQILFIEK